MQIELDEQTAGVLEKLRTQAAAKLMPLAAYLEQFVQPDQAAADQVASLAEFDRILDELAAQPTGASSLPPDFSRADVYANHD